MPVTFTESSTGTYPQPAAGGRMTFIDVDGDGDLDILYQTGANGTAFQYARSNGDGTYTILALASSPFAGLTLPDHNGGNYHVGDIDGDGDDDIWAGQATGAGTGTFLRNDNGTFSVQSSATFPQPLASSRSVMADFDGDGDADILYQTGGNGTSFQFARSNGDGTYTIVAQASSPFAGVTLLNNGGGTHFAGDFDGDGDIDLYATAASATGGFYRNDNGVFTSQSAATWPAAAAITRYVVGDFDSDGDDDILYQTGADGSAWQYARSNGDGTMTLLAQASSPFAGVTLVNHNGSNFVAADVDGDGDDDLVGTLNGTTGEVYLAGGAPPRVSSSSPSDNGTGVAVGANITVTFNESVTQGSGNIYIVRTSDNTVVETIAVGSAQVSGSGTTWTIDPSITLAGLTGYAIRFDRGTFRDADGSIFFGISDTTTINFTTAAANTAPTFTNLNGDSASFTEGTPVRLDVGGNATVADSEQANFNGGTLTVAITANEVAGQDVLGVANIGTGAGQIGVSGANITYEGVVIGTFTGGTGGADLVITLDGDATTAATQALVRALQYNNTSDAPNTSARTVTVTLTDGAGGTSTTQTTTVSVTAANDPHTGGAAITGTANEDQVLTAVSTIADPDGLGTLHYQWQRDTGGGFVNVGADQATYTLGDSDVGGVVRVVIYYTDAGGTVESATSAATAAIVDVNDAPTLSLTTSTPIFTENDAGVDLFSGVSAGNVETSQELTLNLRVSGAVDGAAESLVLSGVPITMVAGSPFIQPAPGGAVMVQVTAGGTPGVFNVTIVGISSASHAQQILDAITYSHASDNPTAGDRQITVVSISDNGGTANGGQNTTSVNETTTVTVVAVEDTAVAVNDANATDENSTVSGSVFGNDSDADGPALSVSAVNGSPANVGTQITLASGALLTLNADGTYTYDPNGAFQYLAGSGSGGTNIIEDDTFTYTLANGNTATVTISVAGVDSTGDVVLGGPGNDILNAGDGDDVIRGGGGNDTLNGGSGVDTADYSGAASGVNVRSNHNDVPVDGDGASDLLIDIENVTGSAFNDVIAGSATGNTLDGGAGADVLIGLGGNDILIGGSGAANQLQGGMGDDIYVVSANDTIIELAGQGNDEVRTALSSFILSPHIETLTYTGAGAFNGTGNAQDNTLNGGNGNDVLSGRGGNDTLNGGSGSDTADYHLAAGAVTASIALNGASNDGDGGVDTYVGIENILGSNFNDTLSGGGGNNILDGGAGDDRLAGAGGNDTLRGGDGVDTADYSGAAGAVTAKLHLGTASSDGDGGSDVLIAIENLVGSAFNDLLIGSSLNNVLTGGLGRDTLIGLEGNDTLIGGDGLANELFGGAGDDTYVLTANDTIVELAGEGTDTVQTTRANQTLAANIENLQFIGTGAFTGHGNGLANVITGGAGDDLLYGHGGNDTLTGGGGLDTAVMSGLSSEYTIELIAPGQYRITDNVGGRDGVDILNDIDQVRFSNGVTSVLGGGGAAPVIAEKSVGPQVLPLLDDDFILTKGTDVPQVLPHDDLGAAFNLTGAMATVALPNHMIELLPEGMSPDDANHFGRFHDHDGWLL